jgi:glycosyltransferase involved in cell wall biosynthesis
MRGPESRGRQVPPVRVAAVILSRDRPAELRRLIGCLLQQARIPDEVVIIDNYDNPQECGRAVAGMPPSVTLRIVRPARPVGTATGRNLLLAATTVDLCFMLDDDLAIHDPTAIAQLEGMFSTAGSHDLAAVTIRAGPLGPSPGLATRVFAHLFDLVKRLFFLRAIRAGGVSISHFQARMPRTSGAAPVSWIQGAATMVRREMAIEGGFDTRLELAPLAVSEDVDFGFRLSRKHRVEFADIESFNGHARIGGTGGSWLTPRQKAYLTVRNYRYLALKNLPGRRTRIASWWSLAGIGLYLAVTAVVRRDAISREALHGWASGVRDAARLHERDRPDSLT